MVFKVEAVTVTSEDNGTVTLRMAEGNSTFLSGMVAGYMDIIVPDARFWLDKLGTMVTLHWTFEDATTSER